MFIAEDEVVKAERVKVLILCRVCGETFVLRGTPGTDGHVETGFKRCLCDSNDVDVEVVE